MPRTIPRTIPRAASLTKPRVARNIRLPNALWAALDQAALDASSRAGRYVSANAALEALLRTHFASPERSARGADALEQVRAARAHKRAQDRERLARHQAFIAALARASARRRGAMLDEAARTVERWRRDQLASPMYIEAWSRLIAAGVPAIARALRSGHHQLSAEALAASSPFACVMAGSLAESPEDTREAA